MSPTLAALNTVARLDLASEAAWLNLVRAHGVDAVRRACERIGGLADVEDAKRVLDGHPPLRAAAKLGPRDDLPQRLRTALQQSGYGAQSRCARALSVTPQSLSRWLEHGIPQDRRASIEAWLTTGTSAPTASAAPAAIAAEAPADPRAKPYGRNLALTPDVLRRVAVSLDLKPRSMYVISGAQLSRVEAVASHRALVAIGARPVLAYEVTAGRLAERQVVLL